ncbi:MAG: CoA transferase [Gammaproteobacteria bacterium]|nr:CoA transferase [Gammaproteobacteria bacterium]MYD79377.1 CoA transferase [Gammaproteobacteria bacterium]
MSVLNGIRVLDFGRFIAGPFCGALLGDLGAEVIRIEKVDGSEDRFTAPIGLDGPGSGFLQLNRNKLGFTLNPRTPKGQEILKRLVATADVVIANLPPDTLKSMGLDFESLKQIRSNIILTTTTAFGSSGPYAKRVGFDGVAQAMSGNMHLTGHADEPMKNFVPYVDFTTACMNALSTVAAIMHRNQSGEGQHVEGCLLASALTAMGGTLIEQAALNVNRIASGNRGQTAAPIDVYKTRDGWILVQVVGNPLYERWAGLMGEDKWLSDPRFVDDLSRGENAEQISERMSAWTKDLTTREAIGQLEQARIPCGEVLTPKEALTNEQVKAMGFLVDTPYPNAAGEFPIPRMPMNFSTIENHIRRRAPTLGEHTDYLLRSLGYEEEEINELRALRVV